MTQRQNDTVRHFDTKGHFGTSTKCHGVLLINVYFYYKVKKNVYDYLITKFKIFTLDKEWC